MHVPDEDLPLLKLYLDFLFLFETSNVIFLQSTKDQVPFSPSLEGIVEALRSVADGLVILQAKYLLAWHEFLEEEDIPQPLDDRRHDLNQDLGIDNLPSEIDGKSIFMLKIKGISSDELLHPFPMTIPHLRHHELIDLGQSAELKIHYLVEVRVAAHNLPEFFLIHSHKAHGRFTVETKSLHVL